MSAQPAYTYITPEKYLEEERVASFKSEYLNGEVFAMAGASNPHNLVTANITAELNLQLRERDCTVRASDMRLQVAESGLYTYPDVSVVCGPPEFRPDAHLDTLLNPALLVEVLSRTTMGYDRSSKFRHYRRISSLHYYLLVASNEALVTCCARHEESWLLTDYAGLGTIVPLPTLGLQLPLAEIYRKVPLPLQ